MENENKTPAQRRYNFDALKDSDFILIPDNGTKNANSSIHNSFYFRRKKGDFDFRIKVKKIKEGDKSFFRVTKW